jgi:hypothetical protein
METKLGQSIIRHALQDFYKNNNFNKNGGVNEKYAWIKFGFFSIPIPNPESRKINLFMHDVHHLISDNDTTWKGESAVSAWEIGSGGWGKNYFIWLITLWAMGVGVLFYPSNTYIYFTLGTKTLNVFNSGLSKNDINDFTIKELTQNLILENPNKNFYFLWAILSLTVLIFPFILALMCGYLFLKL